MVETTDKKNGVGKQAAIFFGSAAATACFFILDYFGILALGRAACRIKDCFTTFLGEEVKS